MSDQDTQHHESVARQTEIITQLSDIKAALGVNTNETANIKERVVELQNDVKEMKAGVVSRQEFSDLKKDVAANTEDNKNLSRYLWLGLGALAAIEFYFQYFRH